MKAHNAFRLAATLLAVFVIANLSFAQHLTMKAANAFRLAATLLAVFVTATLILAQQAYKKPPKEVLDILNAPVTPGISVSPTRDNIILTTGLLYPPLADLAQPMLRL